MALSFFLDEQLRGPLWQAIQQHNAAGAHVLDVLRVGDAPAPPLGTADPDLILWGEAQGRVLITNDRRTMPGHLTTHLLAGRHSPGIFVLRPGWPVIAIVSALILHHEAGDPQHYVDRLEYIP